MLPILVTVVTGFILYLAATYEPTKIEHLSKKERKARNYIVNVVTAKKKGTASPEMIAKAILLAEKYNRQYELEILQK